MSDYRSDYPKEPIGGGNPYWRCSDCKISDPQINGSVSNHAPWCRWRQEQELVSSYAKFPPKAR